MNATEETKVDRNPIAIKFLRQKKIQQRHRIKYHIYLSKRTEYFGNKEENAKVKYKVDI